MKFTAKYKNLWPFLLSAISFILIWEITARYLDKPDVLPKWSILLQKTAQVIASEDFYISMSQTILRGLIGFLITLTIAWGMATMSFYSSFMKAFFQPWVLISRTIPVIALALIALLWFSPPNLPIFIAFITMFPIIYQGILSGLENSEHSLREMAGSFGLSRRETYWKIIIPQAWKLSLDALSTGLGFGWRAVIIGEVLAQPAHGVGTQMKSAQLQINMPELLAWTVIAIMLSYFFDLGLQYMGRINPSFLSRIHFSHNATDRNPSKIVITDMHKSYPDKKLYEDFQAEYLNYSSGGIYIFDGPSGSGKTTLFNLIAGLAIPEKGTIRMPQNYKLGYSFQDLRLPHWLSVKENILLVNPNITAEKLDLILKSLNLQEISDSLPENISGGQQQMLVLARSLACNPTVLILDEPLRGLDDKLKTQVLAFLKDWFIKHDPIVLWATHERI